MYIKQLSANPYLSNLYLAADERSREAMIIDPGECRQEHVDFIKNNNIKLKYIVLTHGHGDHIGGVEDFKKAFPEAQVVASETEVPFLADPKQNASREILGYSVSIAPDIAVKQGDKLFLGETELKFLMTPGHTKGGMCVYSAADEVLFSGDTLFEDSIGRTDFPGGSFSEITKSIQEKLYTLPNATRVYPGHMGITSIGYEKENNPFVRDKAKGSNK